MKGGKENTDECWLNRETILHDWSPGGELQGSEFNTAHCNSGIGCAHTKMVAVPASTPQSKGWCPDLSKLSQIDEKSTITSIGSRTHECALDKRAEEKACENEGPDVV